MTLLLPSTADAYSISDIESLLTERSIAHGANARVVIAVARCESSLNPFAVSKEGNYGLGQWASGQAAWRNTPAYKELKIDIVNEYRKGNPDAPYYDADQLAWAFSPEAPYALRYQWACWYKI